MNKNRIRNILALALPIIGGMVSQNVLNLVDVAMVKELGKEAVAATGVGGFATFVSQALILGISSGVQATASRRKGEGKLGRMAVSLNAGILLVVMIAPVFSSILYFTVPHVYPFLIADPGVIEAGVPYLQVRVLAIVFVGINFSFRGYWNAVNLSRLYMRTLIIMHIANIFLNWVFIFGNLGAPQLGVTGAGLSSALSTVIGTTSYFILGMRYARPNGFLKLRPSSLELKTLIKLSLPNGVQQLFFAGGFMTLFWIVGKVGTTELAAANVLINITLVAILPGMALGLAAATLVGQALGREDVDDAAQWGWDVVKVGLVILGTLGLPMWLTPEWVLSPLSPDSETLAVATNPMRLVGFTIALEGVGLVLLNALLGAGDAKRVMIVSILAQWLVFLPLAYLAGPILGYGLFAIWCLQAGYRILQSIIFAIIWRGRKWATIKI